MTRHLLFWTVFLTSTAVLIGQTKSDTITLKNKRYSGVDKYKDGYYKFKQGKTVLQSGQIKNNRQVGVWHYYFINGKPDLFIEYCTKDSLLQFCGVYQEYYENGQLKVEGTYSIYTGDSIECVRCFEYDTIAHAEKKVLWVKYIGGSIRTGIWKEYYENGKLKSEGVYYPCVSFDHRSFSKKRHKIINGLWTVDYTQAFVQDKEWKFYDETGKLERTETFSIDAFKTVTH